MYLDLVTYSPLWYWYYSGASFIAFTISVLIGAMVVGLGSWRGGGILFKTIMCGAAVATMPLGLASIGLKMAISDPELVSIVSIAGVGVSLFLGTPYLLARAFSRGGTQPDKQPEDIKVTASGFDGQRTQVMNIDNNVSDIVSPGQHTIGGAAAPSSYGELQFRSGPRSGETMALGSGTLTLGRSSDNDIVIDDSSVSRKHARLISEGGGYYIEDLESTNGTTMNGKPVKRELVGAGASLMLGSVEVVVGEKAESSPESRQNGVGRPVESPNDTIVRSLGVNAGWLAIDSESGSGDVYRLQSGSNIIGRDAESDLSVGDPYISRKHALVFVKGGKASITDLGSRGGVKVNDRPVTVSSATPGTEITVGETKLRLLEIESPGSSGAIQDPSRTLVFQGPSKAVTAMVVSGPDAGKSFKLEEGANIIGRTMDCTVQLTDETVSRHHAQILHSDGELSVSDLGSKGGTKVGDVAIAGTPLSNGDVVKMGRTRFTLMGVAA